MMRWTVAIWGAPNLHMRPDFDFKASAIPEMMHFAPIQTVRVECSAIVTKHFILLKLEHPPQRQPSDCSDSRPSQHPGFQRYKQKKIANVFEHGIEKYLL